MDDKLEVVKCTHVESGERPEWRALPIGDNRCCAICRQCEGAILSALLNGLASRATDDFVDYWRKVTT